MNRPITWIFIPVNCWQKHLNKYEGSYILVSHDRYFISKTANKIWEIEDGQNKGFKGTYDEYVEWNKRMASQAKPVPLKPKVEKQADEPVKQPVISQPVNKEAKKQLQKQQKLVEQLEADIKRLQSESNRLELQLSAPEIYADRQKFLVAESEYKKAALSLTSPCRPMTRHWKN